MARAFILVMDSLGIGAAADAANFGDAGSDTFGHIRAACAGGRADKAGVRQGPLVIPHLRALGLEAAHGESVGDPCAPGTVGAWAHCRELSLGKDTPSGHWEMAGVPVMFDWGYFPKTIPCFPAELTAALIAEAGLPGILGDCHASGTEIIDRLGPEHIASGKPIVYTSADSVLQIAAHETHFGLDRLYEVCRIARRLVDPYNVGRVIARPFLGAPGSFKRTGNRKDLSVPPPSPTLLAQMSDAGRPVISIGKIGDIFAHLGTGDEVKADGNAALGAATLAAAARLADGGLAITNFVDFDQLYGHRRDVVGYAAAIEAFDKWLPNFQGVLRPGDLAVITADHGCDPTFAGTDHTREHVPALFFGPGVRSGTRGRREGFADIGQTVARHLGLAPLAHGQVIALA